MSVVALFRCSGCGAEGKRRELALDGHVLDTFVACDACIARCNQVLAHVRPVFEAMLAVGIDRDIANETLTFLLDRWEVPT